MTVTLLFNHYNPPIDLLGLAAANQQAMGALVLQTTLLQPQPGMPLIR